MAWQPNLLSELKQLVDKYSPGGAQTFRGPFPMQTNVPDSEASSSHLSGLNLGHPNVAPGYPNISTVYDMSLNPNAYMGSHYMNLNPGFESDHVTAHGPEVQQHTHHDLLGTSNLPTTVPQSPGTVTSVYHNGSGLSRGVMEHDNLRPLEAQPRQTFATPARMTPGSIQHDELFPNHRDDNVTVLETVLSGQNVSTDRCSHEELPPDMGSQRTIIAYRIDRTQHSEESSPLRKTLAPWILNDGRTVVNSEGASLRYSRYLPLAVSTEFPGWKMVLIMKYDPNITEKDFWDRMPADSQLNRRRQISSLESRCKEARRKYEYRDLSTTTVAEQRNINN